MAQDIEPRLKSISEYLTLKKYEKFVIPEYQRAYSWEQPQCDKLWQDIDEFINEYSCSKSINTNYFFGTIIIQCSDSSSNPEDHGFHLIDGQQRTTTFFILLKALLICLNEVIPKLKSDSETENLIEGLKDSQRTIMRILYKAEAEEIPQMLKDNDKIKNINILENKSMNLIDSYKNEFKDILEAQDFETAENKVIRIPFKKKNNKFTNYFKNFLYFYNKLNELEQPNLRQFAKLFLKECQVIEIKSWKLNQAVTMFNSLNSTGLPLADADIIAAGLYSEAGSNNDSLSKLKDEWKNIKSLTEVLNSKKIIYIDDVFKQFMYINRAEENDADLTTPGLRRYYIEINKDLLKSPKDLCQNLLKIINIWDKIKDYPLIKLSLKFNENIKIFIASFFFRFDNISEINENDINEISECLIRLFAILELSDTGYSNSKFKSFLYQLNIKLVDKKISIDEIRTMFDDHIRKNWKKENIIEEIKSYDNNILVYLNEYLYAKQKKTSFNFEENVNIEHIMPKSGKNIATIREDAGITDKNIFDDLVHKIGNKILLEKDINNSISNGWFKTKKTKSIKEKTGAGYKDSAYCLAKGLSEYSKDLWTKEDINESTAKVAERISKFIFNS